MAWSVDPSEPQRHPRPGWRANPVTFTRRPVPGWHNASFERQAHFDGGGTFTAVVTSQTKHVAATLGGDGSILMATSQIQPVAVSFEDYDSSQTGSIVNGLSAWWYTYEAHSAAFGGEGTLTGAEEDGLHASMVSSYGTVDAGESVGQLEALIYQMYTRPVEFGGAGSLLADLLSSQDGLTATAYRALAAALTGTGLLSAVTAQKCSAAPGLAGAGALTSTAALYSLNVSAMLAGTGALTATAEKAIQGSATPALGGSGSLTATLAKVNPAYDTYGSLWTSGTIVNNGTRTWTHNAASGCSLGVVFIAFGRHNFDTTDSHTWLPVTWGGNSMTFHDYTLINVTGANTSIYIWTIVNPPSGSQNIVMTNTSGYDYATPMNMCASASFTNAKVVAGHTVKVTNDSDDYPTATVTSATGNQTLACLGAVSSKGTVAMTSYNQTSIYNTGTTASAAFMMGRANGASTVTHSATASGTIRAWIEVILDIGQV